MMAQYRGKLLQTTAALALLLMSATLWSSLGASPSALAHSLAATPTSVVCPTPGNNACIGNTPTAVLALNGNDQTATFALNFTLNSGVSSWHLTITSAQFTAGSRTLPANASSVTSVAVTSSCSGSTCPVNAITYPVGWTAGTPVTFYDNTGGGSHGQGTFTIQAGIHVQVPANSYTGTYASTITIAFISGSP